MSNTLPSPTRRLVIVEDEGILALDLQRHLTSIGFDVRGVAADSEEALALVERERPDLVLMDIHIQGTRDGIETAIELRARFDVPVVYLTAHGDPKTIERAQLTQPMGYLLKPFKKPDLQNIVTIALARSHDEHALKQREQVLATTLSCIGEAVLTTDCVGDVTWLNPAAEELLGTATPEAHHRRLMDVAPLRQRNGALLEELVHETQAEGRVHLEATLEKKGGERAVVGTAASLAGTERASKSGVVLVLRDLTELLVARKQLEFSERLSALGTLAAGAAHEINNPLSVVMGNLSFALASGVVLSAELRDALQDALDAADRVAHIVSDLRAFAQPQPEKLIPFDPREALANALHFTRAQWRTKLGIGLELGPVPASLVSPTRLSQVFVNLIINAMHAMEAQRSPRVLTLRTETDARGRACLSVSDTGPGIPEALRDRIFEPFFTTKVTGKGTGLGLAVSRSIVNSFGGRLELSSARVGQGCTFTVVLPAEPHEVTSLSRIAWVGPPRETPRSWCVLGGTETDLQERLSAFQPSLVLLSTDDEALVASLAEFEAVLYRVGDRVPEPGCRWLREPFDVGCLAALARRGTSARN